MGIDVNADDAQAATNVYMYGFQHMLDILEAAPFYALLYLPMIPVSLTAFQAKLDGHATLLADMDSQHAIHKSEALLAFFATKLHQASQRP